MQVHKVLRKNCCPTFNFPAKKLRVIVVVRLIYVICTKDGGGGALAHTYYSVAAWPVQKNGRSADKRRKVFLPPSVLEPFFYTTLYYQTLHTVSFNEVFQNWGFEIKMGNNISQDLILFDTFCLNIKTNNGNSRIRIHNKIGQNFTKTYSVVLGSESE